MTVPRCGPRARPPRPARQPGGIKRDAILRASALVATPNHAPSVFGIDPSRFGSAPVLHSATDRPSNEIRARRGDWNLLTIPGARVYVSPCIAVFMYGADGRASSSRKAPHESRSLRVSWSTTWARTPETRPRQQYFLLARVRPPTGPALRGCPDPSGQAAPRPGLAIERRPDSTGTRLEAAVSGSSAASFLGPITTRAFRGRAHLRHGEVTVSAGPASSRG